MHTKYTTHQPRLGQHYPHPPPGSIAKLSRMSSLQLQVLCSTLYAYPWAGPALGYHHQPKWSAFRLDDETDAYRVFGHGRVEVPLPPCVSHIAIVAHSPYLSALKEPNMFSNCCQKVLSFVFGVSSPKMGPIFGDGKSKKRQHLRLKP